MVAYLKAFRFQNLIFMLLCIYLMRYCIISPAIKLYGLNLQLSFFDFNLLAFALVLIAGGGYLINDYFDLKIDRINKPEKMIVGNLIPRKNAIKTHIFINLFALLTSSYALYNNQSLNYFSIYLISIGLLWFYSTTYKHMLLIGNLIISLLIGLVPLVVSMIELKLISEHNFDYLNLNQLSLVPVFMWILGFSFFAFWLNLSREIIKDMADFKGDAYAGSNSLVVSYGINKSKWLVYALYCIAIVVLFYIYIKFLNDNQTLYYLLLVIVFPILYAIYLLKSAHTRKDFLTISSINKFVLLSGMLYAFIFYSKLS